MRAVITHNTNPYELALININILAVMIISFIVCNGLEIGNLYLSKYKPPIQITFLYPLNYSKLLYSTFLTLTPQNLNLSHPPQSYSPSHQLPKTRQ